MSIYALAMAGIQSANPNIAIAWIQSTGYTTAGDGTRTSTNTTTGVQAQIQGLSAADVKHMDSLNIQGVLRSVHMFGNVQGVVRADQQGGDILQFSEIPGGTVRNWKVVQVMETWPDWARVVVQLQAS